VRWGGYVKQQVKDKKLRFTALLHHIYNPETLRKAYFRLKKDAAPGVDGETWRHYGETLEDNLQDLSHRLKRGAYRAKPVRRAYIDKNDGRKRPLGVPVLEASLAVAAEPERPRSLGSNAAPHHTLAAFAFCLSSLSFAPHGRYHLRQEPDAGNPLVRIRGGGHE
jgi:hypothetical protein